MTAWYGIPIYIKLFELFLIIFQISKIGEQKTGHLSSHSRYDSNIRLKVNGHDILYFSLDYFGFDFFYIYFSLLFFYTEWQTNISIWTKLLIGSWFETFATACIDGKPEKFHHNIAKPIANRQLHFDANYTLWMWLVK